jgi:hypothetical protein
MDALAVRGRCRAMIRIGLRDEKGSIARSIVGVLDGALNVSGPILIGNNPQAPLFIVAVSRRVS